MQFGIGFYSDCFSLMIVSEGLGFGYPAGFYNGVVDPGLNLLYTYSPGTELDNDFVEQG